MWNICYNIHNNKKAEHSKTSFSEKNFWKDLEFSIKSFSWVKIFLAIESLIAIVAS